MGKVLIPHGSTPTGFGLRQRRSGALRPTSKCCGRSMDESVCRCRGCGKEYRDESIRLHASLGNNVSADADSGTIESWLQRITGWSDLKVEVKR